MMDELQRNLGEIRRLVRALKDADWARWTMYGPSSGRWWLLVLLLTGPWIVYAAAADRRKILETVLFGCIIAMMTVLIDTLGYFFDFWDYPVELLPMFPGAWSFDLAMVPVALMLVYQRFRTRKSFTAALFVMALAYAFIGEPLACGLNLVAYSKWRYYYSFCLYLLSGIVVRAVVEKLRTVSRNAA